MTDDDIKLGDRYRWADISERRRLGYPDGDMEFEVRAIIRNGRRAAVAVTCQRGVVDPVDGYVHGSRVPCCGFQLRRIAEQCRAGKLVRIATVPTR